MRSDETPVEAMYRELKEETGLSPDQVKLILGLTDEPEFTSFKWVDFWYPVDNVITFKRQVYHRALSLLEPMVQI
jgi:putative (di)nucleoside polyphosphate hydrolase